MNLTKEFIMEVEAAGFAGIIFGLALAYIGNKFYQAYKRKDLL